ncbi:MAG: hypothetical protein AUJ39_02145 [Parcubacteria group bacterium CG1_02_42_13]|uniref:Sodium:proton exchanger n=1 Tax=Candidatus Colwellbacteria bacterium CG23_combo_of_CG06-09_8_20_14_all_42_19 TaxID=1974541 RepID=A0A2H0AMG1_9BACT|nr:MAG: hypothetical protein AUJ39_02145 [Parcubacteria group bacterium CG1_02_42_13]PIP46609.1 MAG: sodium:proton exchanger [Candidatus Colwellbacteria bacterium CG23_combo_of_CG06-09_8_20_14_all_42_19]
MLFTEIVIAVISAAAIGILFHILRQPSIIGFIVAGLIIGSLGYLAQENIEVINNLASIGVALLLFIVGLEMNIKELRHIGRAAILVGLGQIIFTFTIGYFVCYALGFTNLTSFYISIAITFSSTIVVVKLLSEKKDLKSLYGRIVLGALLVQDLVAILVILFLTGFSGKEAAGMGFVVTLLKGAVFVGLLILASKYLPKLLDLIGRSRELLFLFSIAWALGIAALAGSSVVGLSIEVGGFLAGLSLAGSAENFQISSRLRPLRDFFLILFFVGLGANMLLGITPELVTSAIALSFFVLIGNPIIILIVMSVMGYRARTAFLSGLAFAQVSEFSFVVIALGGRLGHLGAPEMSLVTLIGIITIFASSYFIYYGDRIYEFMKPGVKFLEKRKGLVEEFGELTNLKNHLVLVGVHRMGQAILRALSNSTRDFVAVDFDPVVVKNLREYNLPVFYGDITEEAIQESVGLDKAHVVISTAPDFRDNLAVLEIVRRSNPKTKVILTSESETDALELYRKGADYVILPHFLGGRELVEIVDKDHSFTNLEKLKRRDLELIGNSLT